MYLNIIKAVYEKPTANIILNSEKLKAFQDQKQDKDAPSHHRYTTILATAIREEREVKAIKTGKEEVKLSPFADDMILYTENPKGATRELLELINEFGQVAGYKIYIQKYVAFLYNKNER